MYWAQALAEQDKNAALKAKFAKLAQLLSENEATILSELNAAQGNPVDIGGYYHADAEKATQAMRPSAMLNAALASVA
jgi:isocitrate dehydrogenase